MGSWYAVKNGVGYIFAAVGAVVEADIREKFKCMVRTIYLSIWRYTWCHEWVNDCPLIFECFIKPLRKSLFFPGTEINNALSRTFVEFRP